MRVKFEDIKLPSSHLFKRCCNADIAVIHQFPPSVVSCSSNVAVGGELSLFNSRTDKAMLCLREKKTNAYFPLEPNEHAVYSQPCPWPTDERLAKAA